MKEKDIKITTLSDAKLQIFSPPVSVCSTSKSTPQTPIIENKNTVIYPNKSGFTYFSKVEYLGEGGFSKVYKYRGDLENKAVKKVMADPKYYSKALTAEDSIKREVYGMTKVDCNHSLKVYGVYQNNDKNIFYILMEQCDGNIEKYMKDRGYPLNINEILILLNQLNEAFSLLNKNNIIHRDIKPSNILYKEEKDIDPHNKRINKKLFEGKKFTFKLGDYGVCIPLYDASFSKSQFMGTLDYMAPEIYDMKCEKEHPVYTKKIDLFSLGQSILWLLGFFKKATTLTKTSVEDLKNNCKLFSGNRKEKLLADLVFNHLLIFDPEERDGWEEYFNHPLFEEYGIDNNNDFKNYTEENSQRVKKRVINRNDFGINKNSKLFNSEKKVEITNKLKLKIINNENKNNITKKDIVSYKYKININAERKPYINSLNNKTFITQKNKPSKNLKYSNERLTSCSPISKQNINSSNSNIEKKKTFDYQRIKKIIENKENILSKEKNNQPNQILNTYHNNYDILNKINKDRNSVSVLSGLRSKKSLNDMNSHFFAVRSKYKKMGQKNEDNDENKNKIKIIQLDKKKVNLSFSKNKYDNKKNEEEKKSNSKYMMSKSYKKSENFVSNIGLIEKKNTLIRNNFLDKSENPLNKYNKYTTMNQNENSKYNNIKPVNTRYHNISDKKYTSIKVINYRLEENKKNKNIGFYFSKYSNVTNKAKPKDEQKCE